MRPFDHYSPTSLPEAYEVLSGEGRQVRVIAGGSDLLLKMQAGEMEADTLLDIKRLPELRGIAYDEGSGLHLGAVTTLRELSRSADVQSRHPVLAQTASQMASEQIRCFATLGGNLCNAAPSADLAPPLLALGAEVILCGPDGDRRIPLEEFFHGPGESALQPGELMKEVVVPPAWGSALYVKHAQRAYMDIALVGVAVCLDLSEGVVSQVRVALGAVAPVPMRASAVEVFLTGKPITEELIQEASDLAAEECRPIDDIRCSAQYRRRMVRVLSKRLLHTLASDGTLQ